MRGLNSLADEQNCEQENGHDQNQRHTGCACRCRERAPPSVFETLIQGEKNDSEYCRPPERRQKRLEHPKHQVPKTQHEAVEQYIAETIVGIEGHGASRSP